MSAISESQVVEVVRAVNALDLPEDTSIYVDIKTRGRIDVRFHVWGGADELRAVRRAVGTCTKQETPSGMVLKATQLGDFTTDNLDVAIFPPDGTCERVQVGTEERPVTVETGEVEQVPVYEWQCEGVLSSEVAS